LIGTAVSGSDPHDAILGLPKDKHILTWEQMGAILAKAEFHRKSFASLASDRRS
jgi:hypothetical protein